MADNNPYLSIAQEDKLAGAVPPTPGASDNPYTAMAQQDLEQSKQQMKAMLDIVSPVNPDEAAETLKLQRTSGLPQDTIRDNLIEVRRRERVRLLDAQKILTDSPVLARQLSDPNFAKIAHDDVGPMSNIEMAASYLGRSLSSGVLTLGGTVTKLAHEGLSLVGMTTPEDDIARLLKNDPAKLDQVMESPAMSLVRWSKYQQKAANAIMAGAPDAVKSKYSGLEYFTSDSDNAAYLSPVKMIGDAFQSLPTTLALMASMYITKSRASGTYAELIEAGATREVAAKEAARVAADTMARVSAISEGLAGYAVQANQTRVEVDKITQAQLEQSPKYQELIADGYTPETARVYLSAITAERAGSIAGIVDAVTNFFGGKVLGRVIGEGGALVPRVGKGFATEALTEMPQSIGEQFGQNLAVKQLMNPNQNLGEGLAEAGAAGFFVGGLTGGTFAGVLSNHQAQQGEAGKATVMFDMLGRLNDLAAANKVRERDVQSFETFMQSIEQDSGGPVNTLYIAPQTLVETLMAAGVNIGEVKATLPSLANLDEQLRTGTMVSIPVSEFASRIAGSEYAQAILPQLKTDPNGMSKVEADEWMKTQGDQLKADVEKVLGEAQKDGEFKASMETVKQQVLGQIAGTQRFTKDVNEAYATLMSTFYGVTAAKLGITPEQMANQYPIKITAESVTGGEQYDQAGKLKTDTPQFKQFFGNSKVVDKEGKPLVVYRGMSGESMPAEGVTQMRPTPGLLGTGIYMTGSTKRAEGYTRGENGQTYPLYVSIQNPISEDDFVERFGKGKRSAEESQAITDQLISEGYDGVISQNGPGNVWEVVAFKSTQVKSAIGNNGQYDTNEDNILFQSLTTMVPFVKGATVNPTDVQVPGLEAADQPDEKSQKAMEANVETFDKKEQEIAGKTKRGYDSIKVEGDTTRERAESIIEQMVRNLRTIFNAIPESIRQRSKLWYDGANRIANAFADRYGITPMQAAGQLAVTSPQADWYMNVSYVERVNDILTTRQDHLWDAEMEAWAEGWITSKTQVEARANEADRRAQAIKDAVKDEKDAQRALVKAKADLEKKTPKLEAKIAEAEAALAEADAALKETTREAKKALGKDSTQNVEDLPQVKKAQALRDKRNDAAKDARSDLRKAKSSVGKAETAVRNAGLVIEEKRAYAEIPDPNVQVQALVRGKKLSELTTDFERAWWVRSYDEAHNPRSYRVVSPEGAFLDFAKLEDGVTNDSIGWKSFSAIAKAISIFNDGSVENIHAQLGGEHKVRNFYNNIFDPNSETPFVTSDTHQVAANLFLPLGADALEVGQNFGGTGSKSVGATGLNGTYWLYHEAVVRAAKAEGVKPREMQSISWEAIRNLFSPSFKASAESVNAVRDLWVKYQQGEATYEQTIRDIVDLAGGRFRDPAWVGTRPDSAAAPENGATSYESNLAHAGSGEQRRVQAGPGNQGVPGSALPGGQRAGEYNQDQPTFFSQLQRSVEQAKQAKAPASDWMAIISKLPGVKAEEIEWTGLKDYLALRGKDQVTKQEITDYLAANGVQVEDVTLTGDELALQDEPQVYQRSDGSWAVIDPDTSEQIGGDYETESEARDAVSEMWSRSDGAAKYGQYTLPGGENYRELLLTLPQNNSVSIYGYIKGVDADTLDDILTDISADGMESLNYGRDDQDNSIVFEDVDSASWNRIEVIAKTYGAKAVVTSREGSQDSYSSSHWDQANVLAHIRVNDRVDADGNKVLFVEEVQSDWGQEGKKRGFTLSAQEEARRDSRLAQLTGQIGELLADGVSTPPEGQALSDVDPRFLTLQELIRERDALQTRTTNNSIPVAPFVTKTEGWLNLALKRITMMAVEGGYDKVAFVNGQQSADRYDLSKQIESITHAKNEDGTYTIMATDINGRVALNDRSVQEDKIEDIVGKEIAQKIIAGDGQSFAKGSVSEGMKKLSGLDLQVGGEGMKTFYDKLVPQALNKLLPKLGGEKLQKLGIELPATSSNKSAGDFTISQDINEEFNGRVTLLRRMPDGTTQELGEMTREEAYNYIDNPANHTGQTIEQLGFTVTDKMREQVMQGLPLFQDENAPRGKIAFGQDITQQASVITLLKAANLSTFLHESGHFFLEVTADIAARPDAPEQITNDMDAILKWFGVENIQTWRGMDIEQKRPYHEQFARGFEAYLFEGKSPNMELTGIFQRFRAWMVSIYKQLTALNVTLDDEIRGVFDRMVASTESIQQAEQARSYVPMFTTKPPFMSDDEWKDYQQSDLEATQDAISDLEKRSLRDMQWLTNAKSRILKALQKDAAEKRKDVRREVEAEVMAEPVYRAREFLKRGTLDGEAVEGGYKLSLPEIEEMYEGNPIVGMIKSTLGFGKYGMLGKENGIHPNQVAELFGFSSGDHLVRSLLEATDPRQVIDQRTDARMLERYGDINSPEALSKAADEAIHNDARARFVATEANALAKATGRPKVLASAAKQYASELIARLKIRDIRPGQYAASAARAAKNAAKPGVDLIEAATEKRNQLINTYAAKEAFNAQDEVIKAVRYLRKFDSKNIYKVVNPDYLDQIFALLDRFDLRSSTSLKEIDKRKALIEWVQSEQAKGNEPVIPQKLLDEAFRVSYKDMTLEDFRGLVDAVRNIEHLGRLKDRLLKIQDQREFKAVVSEASEAVRENAYKDVEQKLERRGIKDAVVKGGSEILAWHRKFASIIREMDGFKDGGVLWNIFSRPMNDSANKEAVMREEATIKLGELYDAMGKVKLSKQEYIEEIGTSLSLEARLAIALNMGNETNMRRVMEGEGWNAGQVNAVIRSLTREQWNFVQGVWDLINSYWPEISAKERRMTGLVPAKVEARAFNVTLDDGTTISLAGGYYPIKYNAERSSRAQADTAADVLKQMERGLYARAQTARGHLEARVESVGRPMRYDLGVIEQHINQVVHDLSWHETLTDLNRLLRADPIDEAIREHYGPEVLNVMRKTMEDVAVGELPAMNTFEKSIRWMRTGSSIAAMGWSIITAAQQPTGLAQSIKRIGPKWVAQGASRWLRDAASFENTAAWVNGKSDFMRLRAKTQMREMNEIRNKVEKGGAMSAVTGSFFYLTAKLQMVADMPTWLGMYEKAMAQGNDEPRAIAMADQAVLDSQGGGQIKDLAMAQKGNEFQKLWTNFYSYFNVTYNLLAESINETRKLGPSRLPLLAVDVLMLTVVPATLGFLIKGALKGFGDDDDETLAKKLVAENINYLLGTMIGLRELGAAVSGSMGYEGPAGARFFADVTKFLKQVEQGDADEAFWRSANQLGGVLLHYPAVQIDRTVRGIQALADGTTDNPMAILAGPPPKR